MQRFLKIAIILLFIGCLLIPIKSQAQLSDPPEPYTTYLPLVVDSQRFEMVGPDGGNIENMVISPSQPDTMYVGNWGSGVYKSIDGGNTWKFAGQGITNPFIFSLAVDPLNPDKLYAGTYGGGVFKSINGGVNWVQVSSGLNMPAVVYVITIDKNDTDVIYIGTRNKNSGTWGFTGNLDYHGGIYKTTDGGTNWTHCAIPNNDDYVYDIAIDPTNSHIVYSSMHYTGVFKSLDSGATWTSKNTGLNEIDALHTRGIEINPDNPSELYLATWGTGSFYYSANGGENWSNRKSGLGGTDTKVWKITMDPRSPGTVYAATLNEGLYRTTNKGINWSPIAYLSYFHTGLVIHPDNSQILFTGTKLTGLWKSSNGGTNWATSHAGIQANNIVSALNDPTNPEVLYASAYGNGLWKSLDNGATWFEINTGLPDKYITTIVFKPGDSNTLYAGVRNNGIFASTDGGANWTSRNGGLPVISESPLKPAMLPIFDHPTSMTWYVEAQEDFILEPIELQKIESERATYSTVNTIAISTSNPNIMVIGTAGKGIFRSTNGGVSWLPTTFAAHTLFASLIDSTNNSKAYMGLGYPNALARTVDPTLYDWVLSNSGMQYQKVNALIFDHSGNNVLYAGTSDDPNFPQYTMPNGVFKSTNYGSNWTNIGLTDYAVTSLLNHPQHPEWIMAGTTDGLFISTTGEDSWSLYNPAIWNQTATTLSPGFGDNLMLMGTDGGNLVLIKR